LLVSVHSPPSASAKPSKPCHLRAGSLTECIVAQDPKKYKKDAARMTELAQACSGAADLKPDESGTEVRGAARLPARATVASMHARRSADGSCVKGCACRSFLRLHQGREQRSPAQGVPYKRCRTYAAAASTALWSRRNDYSARG
jgi:hypothetical protein